MTAGLAERLTALHVGDPICHKTITVTPLRTERPSPLEYLTLDEATEAGLVHIEELPGGGSVPELRVRKVLLGLEWLIDCGWSVRVRFSEA